MCTHTDSQCIFCKWGRGLEAILHGGWQPILPNPPNTATEDIQVMMAKLKPQLQEKLNMDIGQCQALFYYSQVVAGFNFLILVSCHAMYVTLTNQ